MDMLRMPRTPIEVKSMLVRFPPAPWHVAQWCITVMQYYVEPSENAVALPLANISPHINCVHRETLQPDMKWVTSRVRPDVHALENESNCHRPSFSLYVT